jgi:hypothetical protein
VQVQDVDDGDGEQADDGGGARQQFGSKGGSEGQANRTWRLSD